ncbi:MAG: EamA family transporter [Desulfocapsaceae bacterium]|nr:EamA family transporter [Desulfocapsaceae bacterium]
MSTFQPSLSSRQLLGWLAIFGSAASFYLATVIIRWSASYVEIAAPYFVFARFFLGFLVVSSTMLVIRQPFKPKRYHLLLGRTIANTIAVFCFYKAVEVGTLAEANILNMTYPLFVTLFSWFLIREQRDPFSFVIVAVAFVGIWLIISPGDMSIRFHTLWGLGSGFSAAFAMIYLNISRRVHDSQTILLFMFGCGALIIFILFRSAFFWPNLLEFFFLFICSVAGVGGQYLITFGFRYVTAVEGSIMSSSRILLAALLGPYIVGEPSLTLFGWLGAVLLFSANSGLALRRMKKKAAGI